MENKYKKEDLILMELKRLRKMNDKFCYLNDSPPTPYMEGSNKIIDDMINYIEKLK